jgi:membrane protease YdiL (CAAX protease family)
MTTLTVDKPSVSKEPAVQATWVKRLILFVVLLICELAIFVLGSNYFDVFPTNKNLTYNLIISAVFLTAALWLKRTERWNIYWRVAYAFFVASVAPPVTLLTIDWLSRLMGRFALSAGTSQGLAVAKVLEVILVVVSIIVLTKLSGADLGSIFLKRGDLKLGLGIGGLVFVNFATSALLFFAMRFTSLGLLGAAIVWGLVFSFANGLMEELWLRGIFLRHFMPLIGAHGAVWITAIIFAVMHGAAYYFMPAALPVFVMNTLTLGLACGYLIVKSDSIWGAVLIHAAADLFLFISTLSNA